MLGFHAKFLDSGYVHLIELDDTAALKIMIPVIRIAGERPVKNSSPCRKIKETA